jgi:hypothetical protein
MEAKAAGSDIQVPRRIGSSRHRSVRLVVLDEVGSRHQVTDLGQTGTADW